MTWRPIESDPPPEGRLMLWCKSIGPDMRWDEKREKYERLPIGAVFGRCAKYFGGEETLISGDGMLGGWEYSHWQPIPDAPEES